MERSSAIELITRVGWLSRQRKAVQDALLAAAHYRSYEAGEVVYGLGDDPGGLFGLAQGELSVLIAPMALPPTFVHIAQPGWWVGEAALITRTPRRAGLAARSKSWLFLIDRSSVEKLAAADPRLWRNLAEITVSHLDHALVMVAALAQKKPRLRVLAILAYIASTAGHQSDVTVSLTHEELGEMTRLTRNAVRKILLDLQSEGLLRTRYGRLFFPRPLRLQEKLAEMANRDQIDGG